MQYSRHVSTGNCQTIKGERNVYFYCAGFYVSPFTRV